MSRVPRALVLILAGSLSVSLSGAQQTATPELRLISAAIGPGGTVSDGRFVLSEERSAFSRTDDKELVATFQWEGAPGVHRMVATWRGPDGTVSSSAPIEYQAKDRRFGAYWRFSLSPTMALGSWSVDVAVDGQPGGRLTFEVKGEPVPSVATKRVLTQAQLFDALNGMHVILQRSTSAGRCSIRRPLSTQATAGWSPSRAQSTRRTDAHVVSGGYAVSINRGPIVSPADQRTEFSTNEKAFTIFVTWSPQERLRGLMSMQLFDAENRSISQSKPKKSDLKKQDLVLTSWQVPMLRTPGIYRTDVVLDNKVMWRGYVRLTP